MARHFRAGNAFESTDRRRFLKNLGVVGAAIATEKVSPTPAFSKEDPPSVSSRSVPRRAFERTGAQVSILGVGGYTMAEARTEAEGIRIIHEAIRKLLQSGQ